MPSTLAYLVTPPQNLRVGTVVGRQQKKASLTPSWSRTPYMYAPPSRDYLWIKHPRPIQPTWTGLSASTITGTVRLLPVISSILS